MLQNVPNVFSISLNFQSFKFNTYRTHIIYGTLGQTSLGNSEKTYRNQLDFSGPETLWDIPKSKH